jgi:hypothetical protein
LAQFLTEIPPRYALPPFFKGGQGGICSRSVMKCTNVAWSDLGKHLAKLLKRKGVTEKEITEDFDAYRLLHLLAEESETLG